MNTTFRGAFLSFLPLCAALDYSSRTESCYANRVAGVWNLVNASATTGGHVNNQAYGPNPHGMLSFTDSGFFVVQINGDSLPHINGSSLQAATNQQLEEIALGTFGISGTYQVDADGNFESQHVLGCTFPNWIGITRNTTELSETVSDDGKFMREHLVQSETAFVDIVWGRLSY